MPTPRCLMAVALLAGLLVPASPVAASGHTCLGVPATIVGTAGDDTLIGTSGPDVIVGLGGDDVLRGRQDDDILCGGSGDDDLAGGGGDDLLSGAGGRDTLTGGGGLDQLRGGTGGDLLYGGRGADILLGGPGTDLLVGGPGADSLHGGKDRDRIEGGRGRDAVSGGGGRDDLVGITRIDTLGDLRQAATGIDKLVYPALEVVPDGGLITFDATEFSGRIELRSAPDGLVVVEHIDPETYLQGIDEMPFSWEMHALRSQAIAARTYLANLVANPRWGFQATYGFDICDSTSCQVYRGADPAQRTDGDRWVAAVRGTAGRILLVGERPAAALYHSTAGSSTRSIEDVWVGRSPVSYLQAVPVGNESSPFTTWGYELPLDAFIHILSHAGFTFGGPITKIRTKLTEDGDGPWVARIFTASGRTDIPIPTIQSAINVYGPSHYPSLLPALRPDGIRYPQASLSPTFTVTLQPDGDVAFSGEGWGHQLGMSQFGAQALAVDGTNTRGILSHFYSGLQPDDDPGFLPAEIAVGLGWERSEVVIGTPGGYRLVSRGVTVAVAAGGRVRVAPYGDEVVLLP